MTEDDIDNWWGLTFVCVFVLYSVSFALRAYYP